ncbi:MAG: hypothetical protein PHF57_13975 [Methanoregula sp.]|jgi:hypothetical protein|nr:hypothetical protein [Methanoregula sp.]
MAYVAKIWNKLTGKADEVNVEPMNKTVKKSLGHMLAATLGISAVFGILAAPAMAADINLTVISDVINAFIGILTPITNLIIAIVPLWFVLQILAFIMGLMGAVLAMIKFGGHH